MLEYSPLMQSKWPLAGNFLWSLFASATEEQVQEQIAVKLGVSTATISRLFNGRGTFEATARQTWNKLYPDASSHEQQNQLIGLIKKALKYFDELESVGSFELDKSTPYLAKEFLMLRGLSDHEGRPTEAFFEWLSDRKSLQAQKGKEGDAAERSVKNAPEAPPQSKEELSQQEIQLNEHRKCSSVVMGYQPRNYVEEICLMRPIEVRQGADDRLYVVLDINLGEESKKIKDLVVTAGLVKLRVKVHLEDFMDVHSHHRDGKLRGRIAIQNGGEVFVVEETYFGKPAPFLKDTVFEGEALHSARLCESKGVPKVSVTCFIALSDFELDVFDADGGRISNFTDKQNNLRKLALKEFIKNRCQTEDFEGTVSEAEWVDHVES